MFETKSLETKSAVDVEITAEVPEDNSSTSIKTAWLEDGIFNIQLSSPDRKNLLTAELADEFLAELQRCSSHPRLRVLMLSGLSDVFCGGASLAVLDQLLQGETEVKDLLIPSELLHFPLPIMAALEGHAVGGGLLIPVCCDFAIAAEESRYGVNFTELGFTPGMGTTALLPDLVGTSFASEMILSGKLYKGRELQGRQLFNHIVPKAQVTAIALDIARRIAEKPRHVLTMLKETLSLPRRQALAAAMSREHLMHSICFQHPETQSLIEQQYVA